MLVAGLTACENDIRTVRMLGADQLPDNRASEVEIIYSDSAQVKIKIFAPVLENYEREGKKTVFPRGVYIEFFDSQGKVKSWLKANYAIYHDADSRMEARHNVVVMNEKGEKLNTEKLFWTRNDGKVFTNDAVKITTRDEIILGEGLEATEDFSDLKILNVTGTLERDVENQ